MPHLLSGLVTDLRFALRSYSRSPWVTFVVVATLAVGIAAVVSIYTLFQTVVLDPLPYEDPEELVLVASQFPTMGFDRFWLSPPEYYELEEWNQSFTAIAGYREGEVSIVGTTQPLRVDALYGTASLQPVLGTQPLFGRWFTAEEDQPGETYTAVLSESLWRSAFAADRDVIGRTLQLDGDPTTVIGVMPRDFDIEDSGAEIFLPTQLDRTNRENRGSHWLNVVARRAPGVSFEQASSELDALVANWEERSGARHAPDPEGHPFRLMELHQEVVGESRPALMALLAAVVFVLLIACVNVANLLLSRSESRSREVAVRTILGASGWRVMRQVFTESLALALVSTAAGLLLAQAALRWLLNSFPEALPRSSEITLDGRIALFAVGVAGLTAVLFGIAPALRMSTQRFVGSLREGGRRLSAGVASRRLRRTLVAAELALAVALVIGASLMGRSLATLLAVDPGFDTGRLSAFSLYLPQADYPEDTDRAAFLTQLRQSLLELGGIDAVSATSDLPPRRTLNANDTEFDGLEQTDDGPPHNTDYWEFVTADYQQAMGIRVLEGRAFDSTDTAESQPAVLVNETLAKTFWPGQSVIGKRIRPGFGDMPWFSIVGVVADVKQDGLDNASGTHVYWVYDQAAAAGAAPNRMYLLVRSQRPDGELYPSVRQAVWKLNPELPVSDLRPMTEVVRATTSRSRLLTLLLSLFAGTALFLAAIGIYGVLADSVAQRGHEIGIRMALGAQRSQVIGQVLGQGAILAVGGLAAGVVLALSLSRWLRTLLFETSPNDPATYLWVVAGLAGVALLACLVPALRATRVQPLDALRSE